MSNKNSKTNTVSEFRTNLLERLLIAGSRLDNMDRMKIGVALNVDVVTVKRYLENKAGKMKNLELAERILIAAEKTVATKEADPVSA